MKVMWGFFSVGWSDGFFWGGDGGVWLWGFFCLFVFFLFSCWFLLLVFLGGMDGIFEVLTQAKNGTGSLLPFWL